MKTHEPNEDARLGSLLRQWKTTTPLPPRFAEHVWGRIQREAGRPSGLQWVWANLAQWVATFLPRPLLATSYCAALIVLGAGVGWGHARHETARVTAELGTRYAKAVDPYQARP